MTTWRAAFIILRTIWRRWWERRAEARALAAQLHSSTAWHCGCATCRTPRTWFELYGETVKLTDEEREKLRGTEP